MQHQQTISYYLNSLGLISCSGIDALKFLQGQLSCDLNKVTEQQSQLGCYCDHKGRMIANVRIIKANDQYLLSLPQEIIPNTLSELKKFGVFSKVALSDASQEYIQVGITNLEYEKSLAETPLSCFDITAQRKILLCSKSNLESLQNLITDETDWQLLDITDGIAWITAATQNMFTPHQLNYQLLDEAIAFKKGCYRGQEIIARMQYLGKLKQHLYRAYIETNERPQTGVELINSENKIVGQIVNIVSKTTNHYQILATIYDQAKEANDVKYKKAPLNFLELPYSLTGNVK